MGSEAQVSLPVCPSVAPHIITGSESMYISMTELNVYNVLVDEHELISDGMG